MVSLLTTPVVLTGGAVDGSLEPGPVAGLVATLVSDLEVRSGSFPEGVGLSGSGVNPVGAAVEGGLW